MNIRIAASLTAVLAIASLTQSAIAESLGEHPAVLVARGWSSRGIDPNTFIVQHPAGHAWVNASPTAKDEPTRDHASRAASVSNQ